MKVSIYTDEENRIMAMCMDDLTNCTGWKYIDADKALNRIKMKIENIYDFLCNDKGICLYKLNGQYIEKRSESEIKADEALIPEIEPIAEENDYITALEKMGVDFDE